MMHVVLTSADSTSFDGNAKSIEVNTTQGWVEIREGHIPYLGLLEIGIVTIKDLEDVEHYYTTSDGYMFVTPEKIYVNASSTEKVNQIDIERAKRSKDEAEALLADEKLDITEKQRAELMFKKSLNRIQLSDKGGK